MTQTTALNLDKPAVHSSVDSRGATWFITYQPVSPYQDEHGLVVAHLTEWNSIDNEMSTSAYYSKGWAYWNFMDAFGDDFASANEAISEEAKQGEIDYEITLSIQATESITKDSIPHLNPYWQSLVVRTAYDAITNVDEFAKICRGSKYTQQEVQRMIDLAVGAVLSNPRFSSTGFITQSA
jgi:hypothetical protein